MQSVDFVMSKFINLALKNKNIPLYGDGLQTRTFCFIDDNVDACIATLEDNKFINDTINIGNDYEVTIKQLAEIIIKITNSKSQIIHLPALEEGDMKKRKPDIDKMRTILGRELLSLENGIKHLLENGLVLYS